MRRPFPSLKIEHWPEKDRNLWLNARKPAALFDDDGFAADWRPATVSQVEERYGVYLTWLAGNGLLDKRSAPIDRVNEERIRAFADDYRLGRAEHTLAGAVRGIAYMVRATSPPDGLPWLTKLAHRLVSKASPARSKLPRMASLNELIGLGEKLMREGRVDLHARPLQSARRYRDGLMIALLSMRPLRLNNFSALRLGHTLFVDDKGAYIRFKGQETKARRSIDQSYPAQLFGPLTYYLAEVRPILLRDGRGPDAGWLWIGHLGKPLLPQAVAKSITSMAKLYLGRQISPHMFRDCAATDIALHDPAHIGIAKEILSHATLATTERFYNQASSFSAFASHADMIEKLLKGKL